MFFRRKKKLNSDESLIDIEKGNDIEPASDEQDDSQTMWSKMHSQMDSDITALCSVLSSDSKNFDKAKMDKWLTMLDEYLKKHERFLYAGVSNYIFKMSDDASGSFLTNLDAILDYELTRADFDSQNSQQNRRKALLKFHDHVNLAKMQFALFSQKQEDLEKSIDKKITPAIAEASKELTSQLVGLVAIFTALSFIVFGGISSLQSLFNSLTDNANHILPVLIIALAWAFCFTNLLLGFMYFILRIIKRLPDKSENGENMVQRYPVVFFANYFLLSALLVCVGIWAALQTGVGRPFYDYALNHGNKTFLFGVLGIFGLISGAGWILFCKLKAEPKSSHQD